MKPELLMFLFVPVMSWLGRQAGTSRDIETIPKIVALLLLGYLCAVFTGHYFDWQAVVIAGAFYAARVPGHGQPWGWALSGRCDNRFEKWQVLWILKYNPWLALAFKGLMVGAATLLAFDPIASLKITVASVVTWPLAPYIVRYGLKMPTTTEAESGAAWARGEYIRDAGLGVILFAGFLLS